MIFLIKWAISYVGVLMAMSLDNVFWIPDSPEWKSIKKNFKIYNFMDREYGFPINKEGWSYTWNKRIKEVLKHPRDLLPAIPSSLFIIGIISLFN